MFTSAVLALASLLPLFTEASPVHKRLTGQLIRAPNGQCLSLPAGVVFAYNNIALITTNCLVATTWDLNVGTPTSIFVSGTTSVLDASVPQADGNFAKVYQSFPGSPQQTWYVTPDNHIALFQGTQCLDLDKSRGPQTWTCYPNNPNQVWTVGPASGPGPTISGPTTTTTPTGPTTTPISPPPTGGSVSIRWKQDQTKCATLQGTPGNGVLVNLQTCSKNSAASQMFVANQGGTIQLADTRYGQFCLDIGTSPSNGVTMKVWQCFPGSPQQTFNYPPGGTGMIKNSPSTQCLNVDNNGNTRLQTWECSTNGDPQEQFVLA